MDFKQKLELRKQELLQQRAGTSAPASAESTLNDRFDAAMYKAADTGRKLLFGACIFSLIFSYFIFQDWWKFVGSPEYTAYKQRVERGR
jgi:hypothetical protein